MVDTQFAPLHDKIKAAVGSCRRCQSKRDQHPLPPGSHRRECGLPQGWCNDRRARQHPRPPRRRHHQPADRQQGAAHRSGRASDRPYQVGGTKVEVGGRVAQVNHVINAHTDGAAGSISPCQRARAWRHFYAELSQYRLGQWRRDRRHDPRERALPQDGERQHQDRPRPWRARAKANLQEFHGMLVTARNRVKKLYDEGKSEQDVLAAEAARRSRCQVGRGAGARDQHDLHAQRLQLAPQSRLNGSWPRWLGRNSRRRHSITLSKRHAPRTRSIQ